jgi:hypothetical protein
MTDSKPSIYSLRPIILEDNRRVTFEMVVENLPAAVSNVMFTMPEQSDTPPTSPPKLDPDAPSPYPNIELSILNSHRQQIATLFIVEHKEKHTSLTLHIPSPDNQEQYTARAEMTHQDQILDVVEVPFTLSQSDANDE